LLLLLLLLPLLLRPRPRLFCCPCLMGSRLSSYPATRLLLSEEKYWPEGLL
jgi:hypothetical protein